MDVTLSGIVSWLWGLGSLLGAVIFGIIGLLALFSSPLGGVLLLIAAAALFAGGLLALPVSRKLLDEKVGLSFSKWATGGIVGVFSGIAGVLVVMVMVGALASGLMAAANAPPGEDVSNVSVTAADAEVASQSSLDVTWNSRAQSSVDPDPDTISHYNSESGEKFLVVRMDIENTGETEIDLTSRYFQIVHDGVLHDYQALFGSSGGLRDVTLQPGSSYQGWVAFSVPEDATSATLQTDNGAYYDKDVSVTFEHDPSMAIDVEE